MAADPAGVDGLSQRSRPADLDDGIDALPRRRGPLRFVPISDRSCQLIR